MSATWPNSADQEALAQIAALIDYAEKSDQTLLAALLSEAADVLYKKNFMSKSDLA